MLARFQNHNNVSTARCKTRGGRAWPGFEPTRRATLAARTASGRAAAHRHTQRLSPEAGPDGARNNSGATSNTAQGRGPAGPRP